MNCIDSKNSNWNHWNVWNRWIPKILKSRNSKKSKKHNWGVGNPWNSNLYKDSTVWPPLVSTDIIRPRSNPHISDCLGHRLVYILNYSWRHNQSDIKEGSSPTPWFDHFFNGPFSIKKIMGHLEAIKKAIYNVRSKTKNILPKWCVVL